MRREDMDPLGTVIAGSERKLRRTCYEPTLPLSPVACCMSWPRRDSNLSSSSPSTESSEFHQVEGLVCDKGLTLGDLIGVLKLFFERLGLPKLKFKPAYNPYTEPSMEIFSYSEELGKWMEVGNSGIFRPEMLEPMGLPSDVKVIAWGLSLERPTMILYGIDNIRDLFGHKVSLDLVKTNPICRLGF
jgi:phenylalanyl-tRNA synthetase alpha chain